MVAKVDAPVYTTRPGDFHVPGFHVPGSHVPDSHVPGSHVPDSHVPGSHVPDFHVPGSHVQVAATDKLMLGFEVRFITRCKDTTNLLDTGHVISRMASAPTRLRPDWDTNPYLT